MTEAAALELRKSRKMGTEAAALELRECRKTLT